MRLVWATITAVGEGDPALQRLRVQLDDGTLGDAIAYRQLSGRCAISDRVLLNTTAVDLRLGTGGLHLVVARAGEGVSLDEPSGGHVMKLRYTPLQLDVMAVEPPESPHHAAMARAETLGGMPVVCCGLHSQLPLVAASIKSADAGLRIAYCMTDEASLPLALSTIAAQASRVGLVDATISCGQAFGGDLEAVNLYSGLLAAAAVVQADVVIVANGPGVTGTSTPFGHGGVAQGEAINAAGALGGRPIAVLRVSFADSRDRHRVVSHHTLCSLTQVALARATVAVPLLGPLSVQIDRALDDADVWSRHERAEAPGAAADMRGLEVRTMGRSRDDDPAFFAAAHAAGEVAARFVAQSPGAPG